MAFNFPDAPTPGTVYGNYTFDGEKWIVPPTQFVQAGAGAVSRTMQDKARDIVSIKDFGGVGDGAKNNVAALNAALASLTGTGGCIYFPAGKYNFQSVVSFTLPAGIFSVTLLGDGEENTILMWSSAPGGLIFNYAGNNSSVHVRDLSFTTSANGASSGNALKLAGTTTSPNSAVSDIYRVTMRGDDGYLGNTCWSGGLAILDVSNVNVEKLTISGDASLVKGIGIQMGGSASLSAYAVVLNIAKSVFSGVNIGLLYGGYAQGVTIDQSNFGDCQYGIYSQPSEGGGPFGLDQLAITNCQFNNYVSDISLGTSINNVFISNNYFISQFSNSVAVALQLVGAFSIAGNSFNGTGGTNTIGVQVGTNSRPGIITGNLFTGFTGCALLLQSAAANVSVVSNTFYGSGVSIVNVSTAANNRIENNSGFNPVGQGGNITVGASPFAYRAGPSPETIYVRTSGTISLITIDGGLAIAGAAEVAAAPITIDLGPNEGFTTTYASATPTMAKMVH